MPNHQNALLFPESKPNKRKNQFNVTPKDISVQYRDVWIQTTTGGFSAWWTNVFEDDVPDEAPADEADAFATDDVSDCNKFKWSEKFVSIEKMI